MKKDIITFVGERDVWIDFVHIIRKKRKRVWMELEPMLKEYIKKNG